MSKEEKIIGIVITALLAIAAVFGWLFPIEVPVEPLAVERIGIFDVDGRGFTGWNGSDVTIYSDAGSTQKFAVDGATGNVDTEGEVQAGTFLNLTAATAITVTNGATFTPTATYQGIQAASEVTPVVSTSGYTAGDVLVLINVGSETINLADSGTAKLSTDWAAGQDDVLALWFDGTNWVETSSSNN